MIRSRAAGDCWEWANLVERGNRRIISLGLGSLCNRILAFRISHRIPLAKRERLM